jgi:hypothetical protein
MLQGSCLCGAVRYEVTGAFGEIHHCHCSRCRKAHGAAFSTFGRLARAQFRITAGADAVRTYRSSPQVERTFCNTCGSNLTFAFEPLPADIWVAVGTLDDDPGTRPSAHIFAASKAPWHPITDELPAFPEYPPDA